MTDANFIFDVQNKIAHQGLTVEKKYIPGELPHLLVRNPVTGIEVFVELQDAKSYGELPLATAIQLKKAKERHSNILLVSLSNVSSILGDALNNMGISFLVRPSAEVVFQKINEIATTTQAQVIH